MADDQELPHSSVSRRAVWAGAGAAAALASTPVEAQDADAGPPTDPDFTEHDTLDPHAAPAPSRPMETPPSRPAAAGVNWSWVRGQWALDWSEVDLSAMLFASNPRPVRDAIERHRKALDFQPVRYLEANQKPLQNSARAAAGAYFGAPQDNVALCESTTSGVGLLYNGLDVRYGQEILTTTHDYYVTHESLRLACQRKGATLRKIAVYDQVETASQDEIVRRIVAAVTPQTRVLALTWVHSSTGLKMPIRAIADALIPINAARSPQDRILFSVDGVHGFGNQDVTLPSLGCDLFVAGCHKWMFGPRGTGVVFGTPYGWSRVSPTVPSFLAPGAYSAWIGGYDPGPTTGARMTPGGFKAFEHVWALNETFAFHQMIGKANIAARTTELATRLKTGLAGMPHIRLKTSRDPRLSAGIVSFDVVGLSAAAAVRRLRQYRIIGSAAPYAVPHTRLTPSFRNTEADIDYALGVLDVMGRRA